MQARKKTIAIDVDDVLFAHTDALCLYHNKLHGTSLKVSDFFSYEFWQVWGGSREECQAKMESFYESAEFLNTKPIRGSQEAIDVLSSKFNLYVVTSRSHTLKDQTLQWIHTYFPGKFEQVLFGNHYGKTGERKTKSAMCMEIQAVALVDDSLHYALDVTAHGVHCVLFDLDSTYSWSNHANYSKNYQKEVREDDHKHVITRVSDWPQVVKTLEQRFLGDE